MTPSVPFVVAPPLYNQKLPWWSTQLMGDHSPPGSFVIAGVPRVPYSASVPDKSAEFEPFSQVHTPDWGLNIHRSFRKKKLSDES
jgi:hypothetical protein